MPRVVAGLTLALAVASAGHRPAGAQVPGDRPRLGDFGPGTFLAPRLLEAADSDKDGRLSPAEAAEAARRLVVEADAKKEGSIDAVTLASSMNGRVGPPGGGPGGPPGGMFGGTQAVLGRFDKDRDGRLNAAERRDARDALKKERGANGRPGPRFGPPPGFGGEGPATRPGPRVEPADVASFPDKPLYEPTVLRTLFLRFEEEDWEAELADFHGTDVDVIASLAVDGKEYPGVGVRFRGLSSYMGVREGQKRSLNLSLDAVRPNQRLLGFKTLNLLNAHEDPTFLHTVLYSHIARQFIPAPKANFVRLVVNGESWGLYVNTQQFDKLFLAENFPDSKGARWKVPGNPGGDGGLRYLGDQIEDYRSRYEMKSGDKADWEALVALCKTLDRTAPDRLEEALKPILDVEGALRFLALDDALINGDGYWTRASDYSIYRDARGIFHVIPHDMNEAFAPAMTFGPVPGPVGPGGPAGGFGPGTFLAPQIFRLGDANKDGRLTPEEAAGAAERLIGEGDAAKKGGLGAAELGRLINRNIGPPPGFGPGGPGGGAGSRPASFDLDPLAGLNDPRMPLRSRLLAVPSLRARYLLHIREIADRWLDWTTLGPVVGRYRTLIEGEVEADTRKLSSLASFRQGVADTPPTPAGGRPSTGLRAFADGRRRYLLDHPEIKKLAPEVNQGPAGGGAR